MKNKKAFIPTVICTVVSVLTTLMFCGFRIGFVFVDHETFDSLSYLLWALFILNALFWFAHLRSLITREKTLGKALFIVNCVFTFLSVAATVAFLIVGKNEWINFVYVSFETLPVLAVFYGLVFFIAVFPVCGALFRKCVAFIAAAACVVSALVYLFPAGGFDFESAPAVFDTGNSYHVIFATNRKSVGYITYTYGGDEYKVWDTTTGNKDASRVHSIEIPHEHLNGNSYSVNAVRATEEIAYGGHQGKDITYTVEKFTPCPEDDFDMAIITDNHASRVDWTSIGSDAEVIVLLGDIANGVYSYDIFIDNLIVPAGKASMGAVP
ncbi:MAG: hypothetical protein J1E34_04705, partial [Oscillospiraceae bacterium]|nr:hypothetical protein [Oscillospiraceae bacterium]